MIKAMSLSPDATHEVAPDIELVVQLLWEQAPHFADMPVRPSHARGSSNWVFRVGDTHAVRLPRSDAYVPDLLNEVRWLPRLGPAVSVAAPQIETRGEPSGLFPRPWAVVSWVPGEMPVGLDDAQQSQLAKTLAEFIQSLHAVSTSGAPEGADHWGYRCGEPVTDVIDTWAERAAKGLADLFDPAQVREAWRRLRDVPAPTAQPCWVHTDLSAENLLIGPDGRLVGVIDFGGLGVGDRSVDLLYAWSLLDTPARSLLRGATGADDATWLRARAWAFVGPGLLTIDNYRHSMPERTALLTTMVERLAAEVGVRLR